MVIPLFSSTLGEIALFRYPRLLLKQNSRNLIECRFLTSPSPGCWSTTMKRGSPTFILSTHQKLIVHWESTCVPPVFINMLVQKHTNLVMLRIFGMAIAQDI